jgi:hypothetical protein
LMGTGWIKLDHNTHQQRALVKTAMTHRPDDGGSTYL